MNIRAATQTTHLGRYHVVKRLAAGGMADVLLARTDGIEGFQRHVVIKRIHAELLEEPRYVKMFLDEARLAASLHHHNIVQVNDIGEEAGEYFFAMEYVHGEDVRTLLVDASQRGEQLPIEHVVTIITAAAAGLHHAHEQRGMDGSALHIVHRDVSPANILVGYDGAVKVADFGIALAAHRAEQTQSGVLKGKVAYMSPEQCLCEPIDRRSDVFSLGIVLYELVTVRPCFAGDNDFMTMSAIVSGNVQPPSLHRKDLPPLLEAIILKALTRDPATRYQSADELRLALEDYATAAGLRTSTTALADYMKTKFGTKALPWQADADDGDLEILINPTGDDRRESTAARVSAPGRVLTPAPGRGVLVATPRQRTPAPTVPMRALGGESSPPADDDLAIPIDNTPSPRKATVAMGSLSTRPPANIVVGTPQPVNDEVSAPTTMAPVKTGATAMPVAEPDADDDDVLAIPTVAGVAVPAAPAAGLSWLQARVRKLWLAGSIAAVAIAALSLILVSTGDDKPAPRSTAAPAAKAVAPQPLERPTVVHEAGAPALEPKSEAPAPVKKVRRPAAKKEQPKPTKKWDPDALFPQ